jgi:hypothetical protein
MIVCQSGEKENSDGDDASCFQLEPDIAQSLLNLGTALEGVSSRR